MKHEPVFCQACHALINFETEPYYHTRFPGSHGKNSEGSKNDAAVWYHRKCVDGPDQPLLRMAYDLMIEKLPLWIVKRLPDWKSRKKRDANIEGLGQP